MVFGLGIAVNEYGTVTRDLVESDEKIRVRAEYGIVAPRDYHELVVVFESFRESF